MLLAVALLVSGLATACSAPKEAPDARTLRIGVLSDAKILNPYMGSGATETFIAGMVYDTLLSFDQQTGQLNPGLADSWKWADEGVGLEFTINANAKWSDGKPVTAEDVAFSFNFIKQARFPGQMAITANVINAEVTGDRKVRLNLMATQSGAPRLLGTAIVIVPKHIWEAVPAPMGFTNLQPVGSGPFRVAEKVEGQYIVLEKKAEHYRFKYEVDKIRLTVVRDETVGIMTLLAGDLDYLHWSVDPAVAEDITKQPNRYPNVKVGKAETARATTLMFNLRNKPFSDVEFRRAVSLTINQEQIISQVLLGFGKPLGPGLVPASLSYHNPDTAKPVAANAEEAKGILDAAGYVDKDGDGWRDNPDGSNLTFEILAANVPPQLTMAEYVVAELRKVGINTKLTPLTAEAKRNREMAADFDASMAAISFANADMMFFYYHTSRGIITAGRVAGFNYGGHTDADYDRISEAMRVERDAQKYKQLLQEMQTIIADAYYHIPICTIDILHLYRTNRLEGWVTIPEEGVYNSQTFQKLAPVKK